MFKGRLSKTIRVSSLSALVACTVFVRNANAATSSGLETIYAGNYSSSAWQSDEFNGSKYRDLNQNRVIIDVNHTQGGFDAGFCGNYSIANVDSVSWDFAVNGSLNVSGSGNGEWWYGPKVSVNWISGNPNGLAGWYENYIIDNASQNPNEMHDRLMNDWESYNPQNEYLGTTTQDGATYKHYKVYFSDWVQFWSVRQSYRNSGTTSIKPILNKWRNHGLPNKRVDGIKFNVETHKANDRVFTITRICLPTSFTDNSCKAASDSIAGNKRVKSGWKQRYLHAGGNYNWASVQTLTLDPNWSSQKWIFEKVSDGVYRIKNRWTNRYLTAPSTNAWDVVKLANLESSWSSQKWKVEATGSQYRIKNQWSGLYLQENETNGGNLYQAPLNTSWGSMKWSLESY